MVNDVVRGFLQKTRYLKLSAEETAENIKLAKEAGLEALSELNNDVSSETPDAPLEKDNLSDQNLPNCPKSRQVCENCRKAKKACVTTSPNTACERCASKPGLICLYNPSAQGKRHRHDRYQRTKKSHANPMKAPIAPKPAKTAASTKVSQKRLPIDSGKWEVNCNYQGKKRYIGVFATQDQAALANEIASGILHPTWGLKLIAEEIEGNVKLAKEIAFISAGTSTRPTSAKLSPTKSIAPMKDSGITLDTDLRTTKVQPKLLLGRLQQKMVRAYHLLLLYYIVCFSSY